MPPVSKVRRRRNPPSCQSCRIKKLKCDRLKPSCANCLTRRLHCHYSRDLPDRGSLEPSESDESGIQAQNQAMQGRLLRLEQAVFGNHSSANNGKEIDRVVSPTASDDEPTTELTVNGCSVVHEAISFPVTASLHALLRTPDQLAVDAKTTSKLVPISLPTRDMAMMSLDLFDTYLSAVYPILHVPSARSTTDQVYANVGYGRPSSPGSIAFILAICAAMGSWNMGLEHFFSHISEVFEVTVLLGKHAMYALDDARASSQMSIEAVQAAILLYFFLVRREGFSAQSRLVHSSAITMARELGLHRTDATPAKHEPRSQAEIIETEIGRRLWWHLASSDWNFAYIGGPHEGTYSIQLRQMAVNMPRNLDPDDLSTRDAMFERPRSQLTAMSFGIERIKLGIFCQEAVDQLLSPSTRLGPEQVAYQQVVTSLDAQLQDQIDNLPNHLRLDSRAELFEADPTSTSTLHRVGQWATFNFLVYARRCRLHMPFLIRFKSGPQYGSSRRICLDSARKVLEVRREILSMSPYFKPYLQLGGQLSHIFFAAFILVVDYCVNRKEKDYEALNEVYAAVRAVETAKAFSELASAYVESLMEVLRKHQVNLPSTELTHEVSSNRETQQGPTTSRDCIPVAVPETRSLLADLNASSDETSMDFGNEFEDVWQDYLVNGSALDSQSWEALIDDLGMHMT